MSAATVTGVLGVACPRCRAKPGRRCTTRRGWLAVAHDVRLRAWQASLRTPVA